MSKNLLFRNGEKGDFWTFVSIYHTWRNDWRRQDNAPEHFGTDPTDIRIRINSKIRIRIPDHFWFKLWHWRRFALSLVVAYLPRCMNVLGCVSSAVRGGWVPNSQTQYQVNIIFDRSVFLTNLHAYDKFNLSAHFA